MKIVVKAIPILLVILVAVTIVGCAAPPTPALLPGSTASPVPGLVCSSTPGFTPSPSVTLSEPTPAVPPPQVSDSQKWIEVDIAQQVVRLREGNGVLAEYDAATGVAISPETTTWPGVYQVQQIIKGPIENVPGVFVADILIYDWVAGVGIHSMPMDKAGIVLDNTLGAPASGGCVRVGESVAVYEFAQLGMKVWVH